MFRKMLRKSRGWIYNSPHRSVPVSAQPKPQPPQIFIKENTHQRILHLLHAGNFSEAKQEQERAVVGAHG